MSSIKSSYYRYLLSLQDKKRGGRTAHPKVVRRIFNKLASRVSHLSGLEQIKFNVNGIGVSRVTSGRVNDTQAIVFVHGGGFCFGSVKTHLSLMGQVSKACHFPVYGVEYSLAPESKYPKAIEEISLVIDYLLDSSPKLKKIHLMGDSSGGGLALSVALYRRDNLKKNVDSLVLLSPWVNLDIDSGIYDLPEGKDHMFKPADLKMMASYYADESQIRSDNEYASPLNCDLHSLPRLLIQVGSFEILLHDSVKLAEKAVSAGNVVKLDIWDKMFHVWHFLAPSLPEANKALFKVAEFIVNSD
ncbi:alpha/beta hydrolase [Marinigracilibium pacificum]|uniref:Alpha/beta hydrolase n=1 Tax=Marinigracilibium pacificum TaxID=2729599 RepID=A0A848J782_9BACT|nr:alpha/beta hydrolase [Marinigracilibium pacificum]NMM50249.1 alpha/beta hydrolase [Marinigracilibium pacificum]